MISTSIRVLQVNLNRSQPATESALQLALESKVDLILVQEPWLARKEQEDSYEQVQSTQHPSFTQLFPRNRIIRPRTLAYISKSSQFQATLATCSLNDPDIQVLDIVQGTKRIQVLNIYNENDQLSQGLRTIDRVLFPLPLASEAIVLGDFNSHHPLWNPNILRPTPESSRLARWIETNNLSLLNTIGETTFFRPNRTPSVLDLTLATPSLATRVQD
jgi:hypothetical protein